MAASLGVGLQCLVNPFQDLSSVAFQVFLSNFSMPGKVCPAEKEQRGMQLRLQRFSYRFAEQVLNSKLSIKQEIEDLLTHSSIDISTLSRPHFNEVVKKLFVDKGWNSQPPLFDERGDPSAKMDFLKERIGVEVAFTHASFIGIDLLKFQVAFIPA